MNARMLGGGRFLPVAIVGLGVVASGCLDRDLKPLTPCTVSGFVANVRQNAVDKVDVLFMVDNSNSMAEEQAQLTVQFPRLVSVLASGDRDADGTPDFPAVRDLHLRAITNHIDN